MIASDAIYALGMVAIGTSFAAQVVSVILVAHASLGLRSAVRRRYGFGRLIAVAIRSIIPGQGWHRGVDPSDLGSFSAYRRRMRVALAFLAVPIVVAALVTLVGHI